ncbi:unnamed protein product, partial [marine sediment metagenome]
QQQSIKQSVSSNNPSEKRHSSSTIKFILPIILIIIAASVGAFFYFNKPLEKEGKPDIQEKPIDLFAGFSKLVISAAYAEDNFELKPTKSDSLGIEADTSYILTSKEEVKTSLIKDNIKVEPDIKYKIKQISDKEWEIKPEEQLESNTLVKIALATSYQEE